MREVVLRGVEEVVLEDSRVVAPREVNSPFTCSNSQHIPDLVHERHWDPIGHLQMPVAIKTRCRQVRAEGSTFHKKEAIRGNAGEGLPLNEKVNVP